MKKRFFLRFTLLCLLAAFVVLYLGSIQYYRAVGSHYVRMQAFQNAFETLASGPSISLEDLLSQEILAKMPPNGVHLLHWMAAIFVIYPVLKLMAAISIIDELIEILWIPLFWKRKRILFLGCSSENINMILRSSNKLKVHLVANEAMDQTVKRALLRKGVSVYSTVPRLKGENETGRHSRTRRKLECFLLMKGITHVILADESDSRNVQMYLTVADTMYSRIRTIHFYTLCRKPENQRILEEYFDSELDQVTDDKKEKNTHMDLQIFDFAQIQAIRMFQQVPLHLANVCDPDSENGKEKKSSRRNIIKDKVHLLIIGGDELGLAVLRHAMNQAVITEDNPITIEIMDRDEKALKQRLEDWFCSDYVKPTETGFEISGESADGFLEIKVSKLENMETLEDYLRNTFYGPDPDPFTYIAVCLPDPIDNLCCARAFEYALNPAADKKKAENAGETEKQKKCAIESFRNFLEARFKKPCKTTGIPVAFRISDSEKMRTHLLREDWCREVFFLGNNQEYIGIDQIVNIREEKKIREYNLNYERTMERVMKGGVITGRMASERKWNQLPYFKRQSNRALYYHQPVKKAYAQNQDSDWEEFIALSLNKNKKSPSLRSRKNGSYRFPELVKIAKTEHRRFCYYFASEGWGCPPRERRIRSVRNKRHECLLPWSQLTKEQPEKLTYDLISSPNLKRAMDHYYISELGHKDMSSIK